MVVGGVLELNGLFGGVVQPWKFLLDGCSVDEEMEALEVVHFFRLLLAGFGSGDGGWALRLKICRRLCT